MGGGSIINHNKYSPIVILGLLNIFYIFYLPEEGNYFFSRSRMEEWLTLCLITSCFTKKIIQLNISKTTIYKCCQVCVTFNKTASYCMQQTKKKLHGMYDIHTGDSWWPSQRSEQSVEELRLRCGGRIG